MLPKPAFVAAILLGATLALVALAASPEQVTADANALHADYQVLEADVQDCPRGECANVGELRDRQASLDVERRQLHSDRASLGSCNCTSLDSTIASVDAIATTIGLTIGPIEDTW